MYNNVAQKDNSYIRFFPLENMTLYRTFFTSAKVSLSHAVSFATDRASLVASLNHPTHQIE